MEFESCPSRRQRHLDIRTSDLSADEDPSVPASELHVLGKKAGEKACEHQSFSAERAGKLRRTHAT